MSTETPQATSTPRSPASAGLRVEVQIQQSRQACWVYDWDRQQACLRVTSMQSAHFELPADLATLRLEGQREVPVALFTTLSFAPETRVPVRILGALQAPPLQEDETSLFPLDGWMLLAVPDLPTSPPAFSTLQQLPADRLVALRAYLRDHMTSSPAPTSEIVQHPSSTVDQRLREARLWLKRDHRQHTPRKRVSTSEEEEKAVDWRAVEGVSREHRQLIAQARTLEELAPYLQAEQLIRFVPARFQHALTHLLLDEERILAFCQRPVLRHRTGWLGLQHWRSHEGLLLITDRHLFWLRDFLSPGSSVIPEGYIAHAAPLERLKGVHLLPAGSAPTAHWQHLLETSTSPYQRLVLEIASAAGSEALAIEFPPGPTTEKALARLIPMLHAFLPSAEGQEERRVRCLPVVEAWNPSRAEAERLAGLGGMVAAESQQRLQHRLAAYCDTTGEEVLVSALVPALESYRSPTRLVALTRQAVLVFNEGEEKSRGWLYAQNNKRMEEHRYDLAQLSSVQISYSLLGASLRLFEPQQRGKVQHHVIPFQSPAIAWFLPLFTRLRVLLSAPYHTPILELPDC
jgi:hypothetical protein